MAYANNIFPAFDEFSDVEKLNPSVELQKFMKMHLDYDVYDTAANYARLKEFCSLHTIPETARNLSIAFQHLKDNTVTRWVEEDALTSIAFKRLVPEYNNYASEETSNKILAYLERQDLPVTIENLKTAFYQLVENRAIRPNKLGLPVIELPSVTQLQQAPRGEATQLAPVPASPRQQWDRKRGKTEDVGLKQAFLQSLVEERKNRQERTF